MDMWVWVDDAGTWTTALLGHFALRAPSRRVWWVDFGVVEWGVICAATCYPYGTMGCYDCDSEGGVEVESC